MIIDHCEFPDDLCYDVQSDVWFRFSSEEKGGTAGITTILSFLAGKLQTIRLKTELGIASSRQMIGTIESGRYFGAVRSPVSGRISEYNLALIADPTLANRDPYGAGWFLRYETIDEADLGKLLRGKLAEEALRSRIKELKVRCFKQLPDDDMFSIGTECSTTLANLNQLLEKRPEGTVVHLVTDDPTAEIEMIRWADQTKNELLETRKEDTLFHFIVRKDEKMR